jgi:phosphoribosylanthranilate isomerase
MTTLAKICGITSAEALEAARGADFVGFVFFPPSPRAVTAQRAAEISATLPGGPRRVGLFVDPTEAMLETVLAALPLDVIQLHGEETPERCASLRARFGRPVMKALGIGTREDLAAIPAYAAVCELLLLDAKPPRGATRPGGNAEAFDWSLVAGLDPGRPWLLAGGLTPGNVAQALAETGAPGVDVSSGVEAAPGVKDPSKIAAFLAAVRGASY